MQKRGSTILSLKIQYLYNMAGGTEITTAARKQAMLEALTLSFGVIAHAAKQVGIDRTTHYTWLDDDPEYKAAVADLKEYKKDFIESKLIKLINDGDTAATIFAAKTQLKDRGYVERSEITGADGGPVEMAAIAINIVQPKE